MKLLLAIFFYALTFGFVNGQILEKDSLILVDLYQATGGENWTNNDNWLQGSVESWFGITTADGRVSGIQLIGNNLRDTVPTSIWELDSITTLTISRGDFYNQIPSTVNNLKKLKRIDFHNTITLYGLPEELYDVKTLEFIYLRVSHLDSVQLSPKIGELEDLIFLWIQGLHGSFPAELNELTKLQSMSFSGGITFGSGDARYINGGVFPTLDNLQSLSYVQITSYEFENNFVGSLALNPLLDDLLINDCIFKGGFKVPTNLANSTSLRTIRFANINLDEETFPLTLLQIPNLTELDFYQFSDFEEYGITGSLPDEVNAASLSSLDIRGHNITEIPEITNGKMQFLDVSKNRLDFDDIERNMHIEEFYYENQKTLGDSLFFIKVPGETLELTNSIGGSKNKYQWLVNDEVLQASNNVAIDGSNLSVSPLVLSNAGLYKLAVTSDSVPDLVLETIPVPVVVNGIGGAPNFIIEEDSLNLIQLNLDTWVNFPASFSYSVEASSQDSLVSISPFFPLEVSWPENYNGASAIYLTFETKSEFFSDSLNLFVLPVNDAPSLTNINDTLITASPDFIEIPFSYSDVDNTFDELTASLVGDNLALFSTEGAVVEINEGIGKIKLSRMPDQAGAANFQLSITDNEITTVDSFNVEIASILSIEEEFEAKINYYPVPSSDKLIINVQDFRYEEKAEIQVFDIQGALIDKEKVKAIQNEIYYELDVNLYQPGKYIILLKADNYIKQLNFIKE